MLRDLLFGFRTLRRSPGFTVIVVLTLALGIGVNAVVFSILNALFLRPYPFPQADRLVRVEEMNPQKGYFGVNPSFPDYVAFRDGTDVFEEMAAIQSQRVNLAGGDEPLRVEGARATASLFSLFGLETQIGRPFLPDEDRPGAPKVAVLSDELWRRAFAARPGIVGESLLIDGQPHEIVGVLKPRIRFPDESEVWTPLALDPQEQPRDRHAYVVIGRLSPGTSPDRASAELAGVAARLATDFPETHEDWSAYTVTLRASRVGEYQELIGLLQVAVFFVLLLACANVANLVLQRAAVRERELSMRKALGAGRGQLVAQLLVENLLLAAMGGIAGILITQGLLRLVLGLIPRQEIPAYMDFSLDARVFAFVVVLVLVAAVLSGLLPALRASRAPLTEAISSGGPKSSSGMKHRRLRNVFVASQVGLSVVLLIGAVLLVASFRKLQHVDPGYDPDRSLSLELALPESQYPTASERNALQERLIARLAALPGVEKAAVGSGVPFKRWYYDRLTAYEGEAPDRPEVIRDIGMQLVDGPFFETLGLPILRGRAITSQDDAGASPVAVVSATMAESLWPDESPLGKRFKLEIGGDRWLTVVGVAADTKRLGLGERPWLDAYLPMRQVEWSGRSINLFVRTSSDPASLAPAVRGEIHRLDPNLPPSELETSRQILDESVWTERFTSILFTLFAAIAFVLAVVGIYGSTSYTVSQRTQEIGIRMALGAQMRDVVRLVVRQGMKVVSIGLVVGLLLAVLVMQALAGMLYGVNSFDPVVFLGVAVIFLLTAALACWLPARRAVHTDPLEAVRSNT